MNNFYTYELCSSVTPWLPFYIGKGCGNRMFEHQRLSLINKHYNKHLQNKILKILQEGNCIVYRKFVENVSDKEAIKNEINRIAVLKIMGIKLCNITKGGDGVSCPKTENWKINIDKANKGKIRTEKYKKNISNKNKGHTKSIEERLRISISNKGKHSYINIHNLINLAAISNRIKVKRLSDNKIYNSLKECSDDNNCSSTWISNNCRNLIKNKKYEYYKET